MIIHLLKKNLGSFRANNYISEINKAIVSAQEELNTVVYDHKTLPGQEEALLLKFGTKKHLILMQN